MATAAGGLEELQRQLERWVAAMYDESASVVGLQAMPGRSGLTFGFDVVHHGEVLDSLVLRMPPKGVRHAGSTDVLRQIPLLQALWARGVPVAETRWWDDDERWFGAPYTMVAKLPGDTVNVRDVVELVGVEAARAGMIRVFEQAIEAMAKIHMVPWGRMLPDWEDPKHLVDEVLLWDGVLEKSADSAWVSHARDLRDRLLATAPADPTIGIYHGDFQTTNLLFDEGELVAVLDWGISGIGAQLLDLGWLLMMNDPASWADGDGLEAVPRFADLVADYAAATGRAVVLADVAWYRALAGYRFGVISCFNLLLHNTGKRVDPEWERLAPSVPWLFGRAAELLDG